MEGTFKKGIKSFVFHVLGSVAGVFIQLIAARVLGVEEYGKANYLLGIVATYYIFYLFGIQYYLPIEFQKSKLHKDIFSRVLFSTLLIYIITLPLIFYFEWNKLELRDLCLVSVMIWFLVMVEYLKSYYIAKNFAEKSTFFTVLILKIINLSLLVSFFIFNWDNYMAFIVSIMVSQFFIIIVLFYNKVKFKLPNFNFLKFAYVFYLIQIFNHFLLNYARVIQGDLISNKAVAFLSISLVIGQAINMISINFANVLLPVFSYANLKGDVELMRSKFMEVAKVNAFLALPILIYFCYFSKDILSLLGDEYQEASLILVLIVFGNFYNSFVGPNGTLLLMSGREKIELYNGFVKLFVGLLIIYIYDTELWGVALALMLSEVVVNTLKAAQVYRIYKILPYNKSIMIYLVKIGLVELIVFFSLTFFISNQFLKLGLGVLLIALLWLFSFKLSPFENDKQALNKLFNKFKK